LLRAGDGSRSGGGVKMHSICFRPSQFGCGCTTLHCYHTKFSQPTLIFPLKFQISNLQFFHDLAIYDFAFPELATFNRQPGTGSSALR